MSNAVCYCTYLPMSLEEGEGEGGAYLIFFFTPWFVEWNIVLDEFSSVLNKCFSSFSLFQHLFFLLYHAHRYRYNKCVQTTTIFFLRLRSRSRRTRFKLECFQRIWRFGDWLPEWSFALAAPMWHPRSYHNDLNQNIKTLTFYWGLRMIFEEN